MAVYKFIPFEVEHALRLNMQPEQHINHELMGLWDEAPWDLLQAGEAWSMEVEGEVTLMFGGIPVWPGRATGWFMGDGVLASSNFEKRVRAMLEATREASKRLDSKQEDPSYRRIEAPVRWNYKQGNQ